MTGEEVKNSEFTESDLDDLRLAKAVLENPSLTAQISDVVGTPEEGAPILVRFISKIAARYSTVVTQQAAVKAMPIVGAVSGGTINLLFMHHFQAMARGHFIIKRLEAKYGTELVREKYTECDVSIASYQKALIAGRDDFGPRRLNAYAYRVASGLRGLGGAMGYEKRG